jgi:hypothetical protein
MPGSAITAEPSGVARIVLAGGFLAHYPEGAGLWIGFLQYLLGLRALGHDAWWLELLSSSGDPGVDQRRIDGFFARFDEYELGGRAALLLVPTGTTAPDLDATEPHGLGRRAMRELAESADVLWNFAGAVRPPLLGLFHHRVFVDGDPGHLHMSITPDLDLAMREHHAFLTAGTNLHAPDCEVPTLGVRWHSFLPVVHLPLWTAAPDPGPDAPFTSVTHWTWEELWLEGRVLSVSKRAAYLRCLPLPARTGRRFELAADLRAGDPTAACATERAQATAADRELLQHHGWRLVDPHRVASSLATYRDYLRRSRAELGCPKPIHRAMRTGWFSDRSAGYLASGRPVLFEDTGIGEWLPTGAGLVLFRELDEAVAAVAEIDRDWTRHSRAARALVEEFLDARRCLPAMLEV